MSRDLSGASRSSSSSVTVTYFPFATSNPRTVSDDSSSAPLSPPTYSRFNGSLSGPIIRKATRLSRFPGYRFTGMLTRPKLIVPDQNGRIVLLSGNFLLLPSALHGRETRRQRFIER